MCLKVNEIFSKEIIRDTTLKRLTTPDDRTEEGDNRVATWYIAKKGDVEVAFIELDFFKLQKELKISKIFVLRGQRHQKYGMDILKWIERKAKECASVRILAEPKPLDNVAFTMNATALEKWYSKYGFVARQELGGVLEKLL